MNKKEEHKETCFTCEKMKECRARSTMQEYMHPVPCVFYKREPIIEIIHHDNHKWKKASTEYSHMNGVSGLAWCTKCGAEGCSSGPPSRRCYDVKIVKTFREGGLYKKKGIEGKKYEVFN